MVGVLVWKPDGVQLRCAGPLRRAKARLMADRCDRLLARGEDPDRSPLLAVHAERIVRPSSRAELAAALRRVLADSESPAVARPSRVRVRRQEVRRAAESLRAMVARLEARAPISPQSVATVRRVLSDGAGPLFQHDADGELAGQLLWAVLTADAFEPARPLSHDRVTPHH